MNKTGYNVRSLLSTLWIFVCLNIFAKDMHELGRPGMLEQVMSGVIDGVVVTDTLMLVGGMMIEIMIVMVLLSIILPHRLNRRFNIGIGVVSVGITIWTNTNPDLDNIFFMVINLMALASIIWISWNWNEEGA